MTKTDFLLLLDELIEADPGTLTEDQTLVGTAGWDSLAVVGFIGLVDEHFGVTLSPKAIAECRKVADLLSLLGDRLSA